MPANNSNDSTVRNTGETGDIYNLKALAFSNKVIRNGMYSRKH